MDSIWASPRFKPVSGLPSPPAPSDPNPSPSLGHAQSLASAATATPEEGTGGEFRYEGKDGAAIDAGGKGEGEVRGRREDGHGHGEEGFQPRNSTTPSPAQPTSASPPNQEPYPPRKTSLFPSRPTYSRWAPEGYIPEPPTSPYKSLIPKKALSHAGGAQAPAPSSPPSHLAAMKLPTATCSSLLPSPVSPRSRSSAPLQSGSSLDDVRAPLGAAQTAFSPRLESPVGAHGTGASPSHLETGLADSQSFSIAPTASQPAPQPQFDGINASDGERQVEKVAFPSPSPSPSPSEVSPSHATLLAEISSLRSALGQITAPLSAHTAAPQEPDLRLQEAVREIVRLEDKLGAWRAAGVEVSKVREWVSQVWEWVRQVEAVKRQVEEEMKEKERTWREREDWLLQEGAKQRQADAQSRRRVEELEQTLAALMERSEARAREWAETERFLRLQIPAVPVRHYTPEQLLHLSTSPFIPLYDPALGTLPSEIDRRSAAPSSAATRDLGRRFAELKLRYECDKNRFEALSRQVATHDEERAGLEEKNHELKGRLREATKLLENLGMGEHGERTGVPD
ncbi:hypothetical protein JCM1840_003198 [Sporobolomyces johnsonii]